MISKRHGKRAKSTRGEWISVKKSFIYVSYKNGRLYGTSNNFKLKLDKTKPIIRFKYKGNWEECNGKIKTVSMKIELHFKRRRDAEKVYEIYTNKK